MDDDESGVRKLNVMNWARAKWGKCEGDRLPRGQTAIHDEQEGTQQSAYLRHAISALVEQQGRYSKP